VTADLIASLRAQLTKDKQIAWAACWDEQSAAWTARPPQASYERYTVVDYLDDGVVVVTPENADADGVGKHIDRYDPARVLAEVAAKRRTLVRCEEALLSANPMLAHFAEQTVREMAMPYAERPVRP
jgi:Family of unknown function (DUF6221)